MLSEVQERDHAERERLSAELSKIGVSTTFDDNNEAMIRAREKLEIHLQVWGAYSEGEGVME